MSTFNDVAPAGGSKGLASKIMTPANVPTQMIPIKIDAVFLVLDPKFRFSTANKCGFTSLVQLRRIRKIPINAKTNQKPSRKNKPTTGMNPQVDVKIIASIITKV